MTEGLLRPSQRPEMTWYGRSMATVPLDEGPRDRRRIGPFWIEEGLGLVLVGALILVAVAILYALAIAVNRT